MPDDVAHRADTATRSGARERVLRAAIDELTEVGSERASLRSIARRVGITHQGIAHYFPDRTSLFTEIAVNGFEELVRRSRRALEPAEVPMPIGTPVAALGQVYVEFARDRPAQFGLMFGSGLVDRHAEALTDARQRMWKLLLAVVSAECEKGWGAGVEPRILAVACWGSAHGLATLERVEGDALPRSTGSEDVLQLITHAVGHR